MSATPTRMDEVLGRYAPLITAGIERALPPIEGSLGRLNEAMRYSLLAGGKRLRPVLCFASCEAVGGDPDRACNAAIALELVHTYSLIHDDLPCMDDDDLRRGKATNHKVFGEAMAVLAGDGLLTRAFEVLVGDENGVRAADRVRMVEILAGGAGPRGMVGGQALDLAAEGLPDVDLPTLQYIHTHKTGALFSASCRLGALSGGGNEEEIALLGKFGEKIGLAFQIVDDLLDETGRPEELGKATRKDCGRGKATYPRLLGQDESRRRVNELGRVALEITERFEEPGRFLGTIARFIMERDR